MAGPETLIRPRPATPGPRRAATASLPPELLEQVRGRVQLLAVLSLIGAGVDPLFFFTQLGLVRLLGQTLPPEFDMQLRFQWANLALMAAAAGLWWSARSPRISAERLIGVGLGFEVLLCLHVGASTFWEEYLYAHHLPSLTWVPAVVILFPLVLPGPPRRMFVGALVSAAMAPLSLFALERLGIVQATVNAYTQAIVASAIAVGFATLSARVIYGLGRELAEARDLGSYHLEEKLGEGGMGEVWRARHRLLARPAAIKLIRTGTAHGGSEFAGPEARARFEREAQATALLRSPHTVNVFDFGVAEDGAFYYVMELLDGLDANSLVERFGPLPAGRVAFLMRQVCHSLSEAEAAGLVHRDIKPANIFVCRYGEDHDFVKVLDFGLVKALGRTGRPDPALTRDSVIQGTPAFMAPEQAMGLVDLDHRVDLYAAGCVAYWLLTGQPVFEGGSAMALLFQHGNSPPPPPSTRTELPIPEPLDQLVLACLEKDPARRPQTARELSERLAAAVGPDAWSEALSREWWDRHLPARA